MSSKHNTIVARSAEEKLKGLGFKQKGKSRLWLADHQSWLNVVEFTPSRWSKSVSLTNAAHFLWAGTGFLALHESARSGQFAEYETAEQFEAAVAKITDEAAKRAEGMYGIFSSLEDTATFLVDRARSSPDRMGPSWWGFEAGIASGLCGDFSAAKSLLSVITDERVVGHATPLLNLVDDEKAFREHVNRLVSQQRSALGLTALEHAPF